MRHRSRTIGGGVAVVLGLAAVGLGCWQQSHWLFGLGVIVVAVGAAVLVAQVLVAKVLVAQSARQRFTRTLLVIGTALVLLIIGFAVPASLGRRHGDVLWHTSIRPDPRYCYTSMINDRLYAYRCGAGFDVLDPGTGRRLWSSQAQSVLPDGATVEWSQNDSAPIQLRYRNPDGATRWVTRTAILTADGGPRTELAARNGIVVTANCAYEKVSTCTYLGTGPSGKVVWRKKLPGSPNLQIRRTSADLHQPLPQVFILVDAGRDRDRVMIVDPADGSIRLDLRLPAGAHVGSRDGLALADQVLLPVNDYTRGTCSWSLYRDRRKIWATTGLCDTIDGHQLTGTVYRVTRHLIYVGADHHLAVINRKSGRSRVLTDDEALLPHVSTQPDPLYDRADLVSDRVIISFDGDVLRGTDPMTGRGCGPGAWLPAQKRPSQMPAESL